MRTAIVLLIAIFGNCWLRAADVAVLTDGDRFTGAVQKLEKGKLFLKTKYSESPLQIDWPLVSMLTTEAEFTVTLQDGVMKTGTFFESSAGLALLSAGSVSPIQASTVVAVAPKAAETTDQSPGWLRSAWKNSTVSADFGQSYSGLANYNQLSSNSEITYQGDRWDGTLVTHYDYYGASDSAGSTYQGYGRFIAERYIRGDRLFVFPYVFLGRQTVSDGGRGQIRQYGGGIGWTFRRQHSDQMSFYAGLVRSIATGFAIDTDDHRSYTRLDNPLFIAATSLDRTLKRNITTSARVYYFKPLFDAGHDGVAVDASAKIPLFGPAYFTIRAYDTPELRQAHLFSTKNLQLSSSIGIEF